MNKRIEELAEQAARFSATMALPTGESGDKLFVTEFANLIIQECCDVITPYTIKDGVMFDVSTNLHPIYVIKKHFGVE